MRYALVFLAVLAACNNDTGVQPRRTAGADSADQVYSGMQLAIVRNGVREALVYSDSAWMYQARQVFDLKRMRVTMYDSTGALISTITADKGIYHIREQSLDSRGHVVATSSENRVLKTEHLVYDKNRNEVSSDSAFTSTSPKGNAAGSSFTSDPGFKRVSILKMRGVQKGKGLILPGQSGGGKP